MNLDGIAEAVACSFGVDVKQILSPSKVDRISLARFAVYWIARYRLGWSYGQIAVAIDRERHTILNGIRRFELKMLHNARLVMTLNDALLLLGQEEFTAAA